MTRGRWVVDSKNSVRMIRYLKRHFAVRSYFWRLSQELFRRFGKKSHYSIAEVNKAVERGSFNTAFIAYAHGMFCSRSDFDGHYGPMQVACTYDGVRRVIARSYFGGVRDLMLRTSCDARRRHEKTSMITQKAMLSEGQSATGSTGCRDMIQKRPRHF